MRGTQLRQLVACNMTGTRSVYMCVYVCVCRMPAGGMQLGWHLVCVCVCCVCVCNASW